jgi:FkbM family methyltransferase
MDGLRYKHWTRTETIAYFVRGVARELRIAPKFFLRQYEKIKSKRIEKESRVLREKWLKQAEGESYFDFGMCRLPDISICREKMHSFVHVFEDVFLIPCFYGDNYNKDLVENLDKYMIEGPYGYTDGSFDVTVKQRDIVIDAGAWIGDFSAYAASKGATVYAFEPVRETFQWLCKTKLLNLHAQNGEIHPIQKGLSSNECEMDIFVEKNHSAGVAIINSLKDKNPANRLVAKTPLTPYFHSSLFHKSSYIST